jgi:iron complex outermembrane receptor protein
MKKLKFNHLLAMASTIGMIAGSHAVYAQQASAEAEEIVVTGFKASLEKSAQLKKASESIVEAVSAEDIGKLPDKSIAESLMRLPGLATQRLNGRAQVISIRGFSPDYSETLLNGRQQASTNGGRRVEYDQYPAEFTSAALVYKTPDAAIIGTGIAGTVDIQTIRPLEYGKQAIQASARYEQNARQSLNSDGTNKGNRATASYIDQYSENTLGVAFAISHTDTPIQGEKYNAWGFPNVTDGGPFVIGGVKPFVQTDTLKRDSVMGTIEYKPSETFSSTVDVFYSKFKEDQLLRGVELPLQWSSAQLQPGYTVDTAKNVITAGTFKNVQGVIRSDATLTDATVYSVGWNTKFALGDKWTAEADLNRSSAKRHDEVLENYSGYIGGPDTLSFNTNSTGTHFTSALDYTDASKVRITNLQGWGGDFVQKQVGYDSLPILNEELNQIKLSASRELDWGFINKVQVGVARDDRTKTIDSREQYYFGPHLNANGQPIFSSLPSKTSITDLSFIGFGPIISYDPLSAKREGLYEIVKATRADVLAGITTIDEKVTTLFAKVGLAGEMSDIPVKGNIGLQVVSTDQSSNGSSASGQQNNLSVVAQHGGTTYTNFLPSVNLTFELTEQDKVKLATARTLSRPNMGAMTASSQFSFNPANNNIAGTDLKTSPWSANGGNPELKPWIADGADLSYEHYYNDGLGYWSLAGFYKDLKSYVFTDTTVMDFSNFPVPAGNTPKMSEGFNHVPTNGSGGTVRGLEFTLSVTGELISDYLNGFGAIFTSSYTESDIHPKDTVGNRLPGLSGQVRGLQVYYEKRGFSARISENYRSSFLGDFTSNIGTPDQRIINPTTLVDAQIGYTFESGALQGLGISLQAYNLNDEPTVSTVNGDQLRVIDYQSYGRSYALNLNYKF